MMHTNQEVLTKFIQGICKFISEGTSYTYAVVILKKFNDDNKKYFPFVKHIQFYTGRFHVDVEVNKVESDLVKSYVKKMFDSLFSELFKRFVKREMGEAMFRDWGYEP